MSLIRGVLLAGKFRTHHELNRMSPEDQRNTLIVELSNRSNQKNFQAFSDAALVDAGAALVFLRTARIRDDAQLKTLTIDDMRNILIVEIGAMTGVGQELQGLSNIDLVAIGLGKFNTSISPRSKNLVRGVLLAGRFRTQHELNLMSEEDQRNTLIAELSGRSNQQNFQSFDSFELAGMGAVLVFLREAGIRDDAQLKTLTIDDMRNILIVEINGQTQLGSRLQGLSNIDLVRAGLGVENIEVHAAIDDKWRSLGGAPGAPKVLGDAGLVKVGPTTFFGEYADGRIYSTPETFWVHGAIFERYMQLGGHASRLGLPKSDELDFPENGKISVFQNGSIYFWPDTGPRDLNDVIVQYTGLHCFGETDFDILSGDDEPYATIGVVAANATKQTFQSRVESIEAGEGRFEIMELYRGKPHGIALSTVLQEHSGGDTSLSRQAVTEAVNRAGPVLAGALTVIPVVGPVLGPLASAAFQAFRKDLIEALNSFVEHSLGFSDRPLGSDLLSLTPKQMVILATRPEGHDLIDGLIPFRFETALLSRFGASYKVFFNVFPA